MDALQSVYTFPDRKLYGVYNILEFEQLKIDIVEGRISEELCLIDSNDRASCFDEFGCLDYYSKEFICEKHTDLLRKLLKAQMTKRMKRLEPKQVKLNCMVCGTEFMGAEPVMCCSGRDCGCMGLPIDPIVCSNECYNNLPSHKNQEHAQ